MPTKMDTQKGRFYNIEGKSIPFPSVTSLLTAISKPALVGWSANVERELVVDVAADLYRDCVNVPSMTKLAWVTTLIARLGKTKAHKRELKKASNIGTQIHHLVEWTLRAELMEKAGPSPAISEKAMWGFSAWERWRKSVNLKPIFIEQTVWSNEYQYAGTMDLLAEVNGVLTVVDWKSGKAIYPEVFLQNAAYRHCVREMGHGDPKAGLVVRLPKTETDPEFEACQVTDDESELFRTFLAVKEVWTWMQAEEEKRDAKKKEAA